MPRNQLCLPAFPSTSLSAGWRQVWHALFAAGKSMLPPFAADLSAAPPSGSSCMACRGSSSCSSMQGWLRRLAAQVLSCTPLPPPSTRTAAPMAAALACRSCRHASRWPAAWLQLQQHRARHTPLPPHLLQPTGGGPLWPHCESMAPSPCMAMQCWSLCWRWRRARMHAAPPMLPTAMCPGAHPTLQPCQPPRGLAAAAAQVPARPPAQRQRRFRGRRSRPPRPLRQAAGRRSQGSAGWPRRQLAALSGTCSSTSTSSTSSAPARCLPHTRPVRGVCPPSHPWLRLHCSVAAPGVTCPRPPPPPTASRQRCALPVSAWLAPRSLTLLLATAVAPSRPRLQLQQPWSRPALRWACKGGTR